MATIEFLGPINKQNMEVDVQNLTQLANILNEDKDLKPWLDICAIAVNDSIVNSLDISIKQSDKISLLPPVCGG